MKKKIMKTFSFHFFCFVLLFFFFVYFLFASVLSTYFLSLTLILVTSKLDPGPFPELEDVWRPPETFVATHPKTKGSFPGAIYTDNNGKKWLGKLGSPDDASLSSESLRNAEFVRGSNRDALKEKISFDFYHVFSKCLRDAFYVPPSVLSILPIFNQFTENDHWAKSVFDYFNKNNKEVHNSGKTRKKNRLFKKKMNIKKKRKKKSLIFS